MARAHNPRWYGGTGPLGVAQAAVRPRSKNTDYRKTASDKGPEIAARGLTNAQSIPASGLEHRDGVPCPRHHRTAQLKVCGVWRYRCCGDVGEPA